MLSLIVGCGGSGGDGDDSSGAGSDGEAHDADSVGVDTVAQCSCDGLECGSNACGEECGTCPAAAPYCYDGACAVDCRPDCAGKVCGTDGCGGACGACGPGAACDDGQCACVPVCDGRECGDDDCGGTCGTCPQAAPYCASNTCVVSCTPSCVDRACGDDGCGGSCGTCDAGAACVDGACAACECGDHQCGLDLCGRSCGTCAQGAPYCVDGYCEEALSCPTAVIEVAEGLEVAPLSRLSLSGLGSTATHGTVAEYRWLVVDPLGAEREISYTGTPNVDASLVGDYLIRLTVVDSEGEESCVPAEVVVRVVPDAVIYIEAEWPDIGGRNVDLHFAHPYAASGYDGDGDGKPDPWYDGQFDCWWVNHHPNWGSLDPTIDDDPILVRGGASVGAPEVITMNQSELGLSYKIGAHLKDSYPGTPVTIRVFLNGELVFSDTTTLASHDLWTAATLAWPSGEVKAVRACTGTTTPCENDEQCPYACGRQIAPDYHNLSYP